MIFYTLTSTCRRLHIDSSAYLRDLFVRWPQTAVAERDVFLPDRWLAEHPQHRPEIREREADERARRKRAERNRRHQRLR